CFQAERKDAMIAPGCRRASGSFATASPFAVEVMEVRRLLSSTILVDDSAPGVTQDGTSWETAYLTLQEAIAAASDGDTILVGQGTYYPTTGISRAIDRKR